MLLHKNDSSKISIASNRNLTRLNVEKLKGVLSYFSYLHKSGEISDKAFEALVRYACSIFIENEVELRIQDALEEKILKFLTSKLYTSTEEIEDMETAIYSLDVSRLIRSK
ncbi:hypothetical protein [Fischerella sp. PCC 9605]|uniref:hypothetical protein n=1 Tax=Fischerella sp. PCC 9605 TaxID=1173024 RepID=UPI00047E8CE9|nr:hypothetical protein [Fischerella sp. PCC 9605]